MQNFPEIEKKILEFWKKNKIFEKSLEKKGEDFVFYEGPPTANAEPGIHHVLNGVSHLFINVIDGLLMELI